MAEKDDQLDHLLNAKTHIDNVSVDGLSRTKDDVVKNILRDQFSDVVNFNDLVNRTSQVKDKLYSLGAFKTVEVFIDENKDNPKTPYSYNVTYFVEEKKRVLAGVKTLVGDNGGSMAVKSEFPNFLGRGEEARIEYQYGTKHTSGILLDIVKPLLPWKNIGAKLTCTLLQNAFDVPYCGYREIDRGLNLDLRFRSYPFLNHSLKWEGIWRDVKTLPGAAFDVRLHSGHSLKSSLKHTVYFDGRDKETIPEEGSFIRLQQEYAGFGGNVQFHKHEIDIQKSFLMKGNFSLHSTFKAGVMFGLDSCNQFNIVDKFFIGGPLNLRGFQMYGAGPHQGENALGSSTYWLSGLHLYAPLPFTNINSGLSSLCRTHLFVNCGNIDFELSRDHLKSWNNLTNKMRLSVGIGIVFSLASFARFEIHYCHPMLSQSGDRTDKGLQFGVGVQFV